MLPARSRLPLISSIAAILFLALATSCSVPLTGLEREPSPTASMVAQNVVPVESPPATASPMVMATTTFVETPTAVPTPQVQSLLAEPETQTEMTVIDVVKTAGPAVVTVVNTYVQEDLFGTQSSGEALGSGVIIDNEGHIVTNNHVVEGQQSLSVIFANGEKVPAVLVGRDPYSDIAVIKVDGPTPAVAAMGDSSTLQPGQTVIAIGSALGDFRNTVTRGIVSGLGRQIPTESGYTLEDVIQTDAAINHGNSGGPLLDLSGQVIGINTAIVRSSGQGDVAEGLGFAIPSNTVNNIAAKLIADGHVPRPYLGISYQEINPSLAAYYNLPVKYGAYVLELTPGGAAEQAGVLVDDIITAINGEAINDQMSLGQILMKHSTGEQVTLTVNRGGEELSIPATLGEAPVD
ncbi:MAG: trypsin-like peptidase domain-containing protein [Chloroflexi bacterium]|nr:trypsin-like peptidase domain-containing protein [Chloroflexota bacterium]